MYQSLFLTKPNQFTNGYDHLIISILQQKTKFDLPLRKF